MFNPGLTDTERLLWERNWELRKLVREMGTHLAFAAIAIEQLRPSSRMPLTYNEILSRPKVKEIMEESDG